MKIVSFAALLVASVVFLSCDTNTNNVTDTDGTGTVRCKAVVAQNDKDSRYEEAYEEISKKLDPSCKSEQKNLVHITYDTDKKINLDYVYSHAPNYVPGSGFVPIYMSSSGDCNINGVDMVPKECEAYNKEYERKYQEEASKNAIKDLQTLCSSGYGNQTWEALLTDEEIAELKKTYDGIQISYYKDFDWDAIPAIIPPITDGSDQSCNQ